MWERARVRSIKAMIHRLYVIKISTYNWVSQPLGSYSLPTKENRVGGIFLIVIIKQIAIFSARICNFAWKCYYTLQQQCRVIQSLCLDNTWPLREAMVWKWSKFSCVEIIYVFSSIVKAGEKNSTAHYFQNLLWQWSKIIIKTHWTCLFR